MSRWSWHEKPGTRNGPITRHTDRLTPEQEEAEERARHRREWEYQNAHPANPLYADTRVCAYCGIDKPQQDMRWTGRRWLCATDYEDHLTNRS